MLNNEYKVKIKNGVVKVWVNSILGKDFLLEGDLETVEQLKLDKELRKSITEQLIRDEIKSRRSSKSSKKESWS